MGQIKNIKLHIVTDIKAPTAHHRCTTTTYKNKKKMGKSKKKEKKKRKRHHSSSDSNSDSEGESYGSKSTSKNSKQSLNDSSSYGKKSKYDDDGEVPDTEEYVYDQYGQPVGAQKQQRRSASPEEFGGYGGSKSYTKERKSSSKGRSESNSNVNKSQVIDLVDDDDDVKETVYKSDAYGTFPAPAASKTNSGPPGVDDYNQSNCDDYYSDQKKYAEGSNGDNDPADSMLKKIREGTRTNQKHSSDMYEDGELAPPGDDSFSDERPPKKPSKHERRDRDRRDPSPKKESKDDSSGPTNSTGNQESLSIEETNKLRAKLGLKPLNVDSGSGKKEEKSYEDRGDVHRPASNISDKKNEEKMREKMEAIREKRKINKKLKKVKGLGEEDDPVLDSAAAWVAKSRVKENEKKLAEKRAAELDAMDEEFGVSKIMARSILKKNGEGSSEYSSKNLEGLKVEHKGSNLQEGESVILTLQDKEILDEDEEDVLHNVNIKEAEKAKENVRNKAKRPGYQAYDEVDEETGELRVRSVLDKYDEE